MSPLRPDDLADADVVHLTFRPPYAAGSYPSLVQALLRHDGPVRQVAVSAATGPPPRPGQDDATLLLGAGGTGAVTGAALRLPERARRLAFEGMGSRERIRYAVEVADLLAEHQPAVVVVWDDYKLPPFLRRHADLRCALVLSQHGRSYHLSPERARSLYELSALDAVITLTRASYRADRADLYAYEPLVLVRPNAVDTGRFAPVGARARADARDRFGLGEADRVVLTLARLAPSKGAHLLVHSWPAVLAAHPSAILWLVGDGDPAYRARLEQTAARLGVGDRVRLQGPVAPDDVAACHAAADVYALPTVQDEGHPLSLLEALASGLPCVASDAPVVRELHGDVVSLVPDPNVQDAFVAPLVALLGDEEARADLARRGRAQAEAHHDLDDYLDEVSGFLARLAETRAGR